MKCVICQTKNPRDPGWMEATVRNTTGKRELISFHRICGGSCMQLYVRRIKRRDGNVVDLTDEERQALEATLKPLGEFVAEVGSEKPLIAYTRGEVMTLVEIVVTAWDEFRRDAAARATPPVDIPS